MLYCSCSKGYNHLQHHISIHCECSRIKDKIEEIINSVRAINLKPKSKLHPVITLLINLAQRDDGDSIWRSCLNKTQIEEIQAFTDENIPDNELREVTKIIRKALHIYVEGAIEISKLVGEIFTEQFPPILNPLPVLNLRKAALQTLRPKHFFTEPAKSKIAKSLEHNTLITSHFPKGLIIKGNVVTTFTGLNKEATLQTTTTSLDSNNQTNKTKGKTKNGKTQLNKNKLLNNNNISKIQTNTIWTNAESSKKISAHLSSFKSVELPEFNPPSVDPACQITPRSPKIAKLKVNNNHEIFNTFNSIAYAKGRKSSLSGRIDSPAYQATRKRFSPNTNKSSSSSSTLSSTTNSVSNAVNPQEMCKPSINYKEAIGNCVRLYYYMEIEDVELIRNNQDETNNNIDLSESAFWFLNLRIIDLDAPTLEEAYLDDFYSYNPDINKERRLLVSIPFQHKQPQYFKGEINVTLPPEASCKDTTPNSQVEIAAPIPTYPGNKWNDMYKRLSTIQRSVIPSISLDKSTVDNTPATELYDMFKPKKPNANIKRHALLNAITPSFSPTSSVTTSSAQPKPKLKPKREAGLAPSSPPEGIG